MATQFDAEPKVQDELVAWQELLESQRGADVFALRYEVSPSPHSNPQMELFAISVPIDGVLLSTKAEGQVFFVGSFAHMMLFPPNGNRSSVGRYYTLPRVVEGPVPINVNDSHLRSAFPDIDGSTSPLPTVIMDGFGVRRDFGVLGPEVFDDLSSMSYLEDAQRLLSLHLHPKDPHTNVFRATTITQAEKWLNHIDTLLRNRTNISFPRIAGKAAVAVANQNTWHEIDKTWLRAKGVESLEAETLFAEMGYKPTIIEVLLRADGGEYDSSLLGTSALGMTLNATLPPSERIGREIERYQRIQKSLQLILGIH